jgi:hypothetical protein
MALPYFEEFGWDPIILKINPDEQEGLKDETLCITVPKETKVEQAGSLPLWLTASFGVRNAGLRSFFHIARAGDLIIKRQKPDVVFFSTTMFPLMTLGRYWKWRHRLPYVLDFQDPWLSSHTVRESETLPAVRRSKYRLSQLVAKQLEPKTIREAAHIVSVSPAYVEILTSRYVDLQRHHFTVLPFGAPEADFELLNRCATQTVFNPDDGKTHWVYAGRGGEDMGFAVSAFFQAMRQYLDAHAELRGRLRVHFIGTDYAPPKQARKTIEPLAERYGLEEIVSEDTNRLGYFLTLKCLIDAHALFIPGSDDPAYSASKLYPYILARKPILAVFHRDSNVVKILNTTRAGIAVTFDGSSHSREVANEIYERWFKQLPAKPPTTDWNLFAGYSAREMTRGLCSVFDAISRAGVVQGRVER